MTEREQLARMIYIASSVHINQFDKGGKPYILHPLYLMNQLLYDTQLATIAVGHDVIEDSNGDVTIESLRGEGFSERVLKGLDKLTHKKEDDYLGVYIPGICENYDSLRVKRKDIDHNTRVTRLKGISAKDNLRIEKYHKAYIILGKAKKNFQNE